MSDEMHQVEGSAGSARDEVDPDDAKTAGLYRLPSADMTASAPVAARQASMSLWNRMFPLAMTGTDTDAFTARIFSQSARPWNQIQRGELGNARINYGHCCDPAVPVYDRGRLRFVPLRFQAFSHTPRSSPPLGIHGTSP